MTKVPLATVENNSDRCNPLRYPQEAEPIEGALETAIPEARIWYPKLGLRDRASRLDTA